MSNGIYVHIPFCLSKCAYCDFNSQSGMTEYADRYVDAVISEMRGFASLKADSVYIGGGTPTVLSNEQLYKLLEAVNDIFCISSDAEITVETNPATADYDKYGLLRRCGVNRLSIGVQSFHDNELSALSRVHSAKDAKEAVLQAQKSGFDNISIDLMEGIPAQTIESLEESLHRAVSLGVKHVSVYSLILEEGTAFYENPPALPDEETEREMYKITRDILKEYGFSHYEISNYALSGFEAKHNMKYWKREPYYGFGAGAHSFYNSVRYENVRGIEDYITKAVKTADKKEISAKEALEERFMLGFRMLGGFDTEGYFEEKIDGLVKKGLVKKKEIRSA